ncbi:hypothetical protein DIPPA_33468 [Diplonema papillatum]|nr:hypothetical protein DIPPA_33468 [Diplonema papillatum]
MDGWTAHQPPEEEKEYQPSVSRSIRSPSDKVIDEVNGMLYVTLNSVQRLVHTLVKASDGFVADAAAQVEVQKLEMWVQKATSTLQVQTQAVQQLRAMLDIYEKNAWEKAQESTTHAMEVERAAEANSSREGIIQALQSQIETLEVELSQTTKQRDHYKSTCWKVVDEQSTQTTEVFAGNQSNPLTTDNFTSRGAKRTKRNGRHPIYLRLSCEQCAAGMTRRRWKELSSKDRHEIAALQADLDQYAKTATRKAVCLLPRTCALCREQRIVDRTAEPFPLAGLRETKATAEENTLLKFLLTADDDEKPAPVPGAGTLPRTGGNAPSPRLRPGQAGRGHSSSNAGAASPAAVAGTSSSNSLSATLVSTASYPSPVREHSPAPSPARNHSSPASASPAGQRLHVASASSAQSPDEDSGSDASSKMSTVTSQVSKGRRLLSKGISQMSKLRSKDPPHVVREMTVALVLKWVEVGEAFDVGLEKDPKEKLGMRLKQLKGLQVAGFDEGSPSHKLQNKIPLGGYLIAIDGEPVFKMGTAFKELVSDKSSLVLTFSPKALPANVAAELERWGSRVLPATSSAHEDSFSKDEDQQRPQQQQQQKKKQKKSRAESDGGDSDGFDDTEQNPLANSSLAKAPPARPAAASTPPLVGGEEGEDEVPAAAEPAQPSPPPPSPPPAAPPGSRDADDCPELTPSGDTTLSLAILQHSSGSCTEGIPTFESWPSPENQPSARAATPPPRHAGRDPGSSQREATAQPSSHVSPASRREAAAVEARVAALSDEKKRAVARKEFARAQRANEAVKVLAGFLAAGGRLDAVQARLADAVASERYSDAEVLQKQADEVALAVAEWEREHPGEASDPDAPPAANAPTLSDLLAQQEQAVASDDYAAAERLQARIDSLGQNPGQPAETPHAKRHEAAAAGNNTPPEKSCVNRTPPTTGSTTPPRAGGSAAAPPGREPAEGGNGTSSAQSRGDRQKSRGPSDHQPIAGGKGTPSAQAREDRQKSRGGSSDGKDASPDHQPTKGGKGAPSAQSRGDRPQSCGSSDGENSPKAVGKSGSAVGVRRPAEGGKDAPSAESKKEDRPKSCGSSNGEISPGAKTGGKSGTRGAVEGGKGAPSAKSKKEDRPKSCGSSDGENSPGAKTGGKSGTRGAVGAGPPTEGKDTLFSDGGGACVDPLCATSPLQGGGAGAPPRRPAVPKKAATSSGNGRSGSSSSSSSSDGAFNFVVRKDPVKPGPAGADRRRGSGGAAFSDNSSARGGGGGGASESCGLLSSARLAQKTKLEGMAEDPIARAGLTRHQQQADDAASKSSRHSFANPTQATNAVAASAARARELRDDASSSVWTGVGDELAGTRKTKKSWLKETFGKKKAPDATAPQEDAFPTF